MSSVAYLRVPAPGPITEELINSYSELMSSGQTDMAGLRYLNFRRLGQSSIGGWWRWALLSPDGVAPSRMVCMSASVNLPLHHKVQKFSSGTGCPGWSRKKGRKTDVVVWWWWLVGLHFSDKCLCELVMHE